jgi:hypothetical protein
MLEASNNLTGPTRVIECYRLFIFYICRAGNLLMAIWRTEHLNF